MRAALADDLDADDRDRIVAAVDADLDDSDRWQQTHAFFAGVARSRGLFLSGLDGAAAAGRVPVPSPRLRAAFQSSVDGWLMASRSLYKHVRSRVSVPPDRLAQRLAAAVTADRAALAALTAELGVGEWSER
jgi:hypothetical protein